MSALVSLDEEHAEKPVAFPLSFEQQRLWFLDQLTPGNPFYNLPLAVTLPMQINRRAMELAVNEMVRRHEALRTEIRTIDDKAQQIVMPFEATPMPFSDLSDLPQARRHEEAAALAAEEAGAPFDLERGPLMRVRLVRVTPKSHVFCVTMHHIISDGWSLGLFWQELTELYKAASARKGPNLPEPPLQYGDFAAWQREYLAGDELERQRSYWLDKLAGAPTLSLPTDRMRPPIAQHRGDVEAFALPARLSEGIRTLAKDAGTTQFVVLASVYAILLSRLTGQDDVIFGTPVANRGRAELEKVIGFFVNSLVLRVQLDGEPTFQDVLARAHESLLGAFSHQEFPFERLVEELKVERDPSRNPLFQVTIQLFDAPGGKSTGAPQGNAPPDLLQVSRGTALFDLAFNFWQDGARFKGMIEYDKDLFDRSTIRQMRQAFETLLAEAISDPGRHARDLALLPRDMRNALIDRGRESASASVPFRPIWQTIRDTAKASPDQIALQGTRDVTYAEMVTTAEGVAACLQESGIRCGDCVAIQANRSVDMLLSILGVIAAGAAYVPVDVDTPAKRRDQILSQAECSLMLTDAARSPRGDAKSIRITTVVKHKGTGYSAPTPAADDLAYVIHTSGSTGIPKGVAQRQAGLANQIAWMRGRYQITPEDRVLFKTPFVFDASIWEIFLPLATGARVVIPEPGVERDPALLCQQVADHGVTILQLVPSMMQLFAAEPAVSRCADLRLLFAGGEDLSSATVQAVFEALEHVELHNLYGPTETCIQSIAAQIASDAPEGSRVPIGTAIPGNGVYLLDAQLNVLPDGVPGDIWITGVGLARGYLGQPSQTAQNFLPDPFSDIGGRMYRTGDRAIRQSDGQLVYLGRNDHQVKLRGFRIETSEVETVLLGHSDVRRAAVSVRNGRLVAHAETELNADQVRWHLEEQLPRYMVPDVVMPMEALPLLVSGKIDRAALPEPAMAETKEIVPPRDPIESALADIWAEVMECEQISVTQDFFTELGGHSLLAIRVVTRIRELFQITCPLHLIFEHSTVARFAEALRRDPDSSERIAVAEQLLGDMEAEPPNAEEEPAT